MNKKIILIILAQLSFAQSFASEAEKMFGIDKVEGGLIGGTKSLPNIADNLLGYFVGLFYFIAVAIGIYGGFTILSSGGEEEKAKKGKNIVLYMVYGLILILLTSQIINWVIKVLSDEKIVGA